MAVIPAAEKPGFLTGFFGMDKHGKTKSQIDAPMPWETAWNNVAAKQSWNKLPSEFKGVAMDEAVSAAMDSSIQGVKQMGGISGVVPTQTLVWYSQFGFIGWQICAIMGQQWLVNKALKMPGLDAVRHGFERTTGEDVALNDKELAKLRKLDKKYKLKKNLVEHLKFARMFGIRHTLFLVDGINYELPFNPDGIKPGSYRGMTQIDPYWLAPEMSMEDASNSASQNFYNPTWWRVNGKRVHRSHFVISRNGNELPDLLKPSYYYGGIPTTQLIYERVYAAERTANESPMLMMSKRLYSLRVDTTKAAADLNTFEAELRQWTDFMNNFGVKVIGGEEEIQLHDTSLAGIDETIMNQYQLVAAVAEVPATKLLGTSPKGFNATGEYEMDSYHEFLETLQEDELTPIVDRHTLCCQRSGLIAAEVEFETTWNSVSVLSSEEQATLNKTKADTDVALVGIGALDGFDVRQRLIADHDSGYNGIEDIVDGGPGDRDAIDLVNGKATEEVKDTDKPVAEDADYKARYAALLKRRGEDNAALEEYGLQVAADGLDVYACEYEGAKIISHQSYINPAIVAEKIREEDYLVAVTPEFTSADGTKYRMVLDGHHSLNAALQKGEEPVFVETFPAEVLRNK